VLGVSGSGKSTPQLVADQPHPGRGQLHVRPCGRPAVQPERQRDVLGRGQLRQQVEILEDEADAPPPQYRLPPAGEPGQVGAAQPHRAGRGPLETGRALQQRRLAGPGDAEHRGERARGERQRHPVQRGHGGPPPSVALGHVGQDHRSGGRG
jgi:hypothetical protein